MADDQPSDPQLSYEQRYARRLQQEYDEFHNDPQARAQAELDRWWQSQRDDAIDRYTYWGGYKEPRFKTTCHRGPGDPDFGL
jgi:hypothetical protein